MLWLPRPYELLRRNRLELRSELQNRLLRRVQEDYTRELRLLKENYERDLMDLLREDVTLRLAIQHDWDIAWDTAVKEQLNP